MGDIRTVLDPKTVALIGASEEEGSVGRTILENLLLSEARKVFPVNPNKKSVLGRDCFSSVADIRAHVDLAVIATPAKTVPFLVEECGKATVEGVIIISAGFKETGKEGKELEEKMDQIRKNYGLRIIGPNCIGVIIPSINLNTTFFKTSLKAGNIAFVSQSGALGAAMLDWAVKTHVGFSMFCSLGSMLDVDFGDLINFLGNDSHTRSIMLYMESVGNAKKFMSEARRFSRSKPIIILKSGKFKESARAAQFHTGAVAGDDQVYEAAYKRAGVIRVKELSDLFNCAAVLDSKHLSRGPRLAIITNAGGFGVMATDSLIDLGGEPAKLSKESIERLNSFLPPFWSKGNPVDISGDADNERYVNTIKVCLDDPGVDGVLVIFVPHAIVKSENVAASVVKIARHTLKPIITAWIGGANVEKGKVIFYRHNIPTYETPEEAVKTYLYMYRYYRNLELLYETPSELSLIESPPKNHLKTLVRKMAKEGRTLFFEEAKDFLNIYGIPVTTPYFAFDVENVLKIAIRIGYPVVLKIASPDIFHKSDAGGVKLGIRSGAELKEEYARLLNRVKERVPQARISGVTLEKMIENIDYQIVIGAKRDKEFGSVIFFGMGGIGNEIYKDISIGLPPLNQTLARRLMEDTKIYKMLQGFGRKPPANIKQLEHILVSLSNLIVDFPEITEIYISPLVIANGKAYVISAKICIDPEFIGNTTSYPHLVITPYPEKYVMPWKLSDGTVVILRPIKPEDEPLEYEMLSTLSEETLRFRFFSVIKDITHEMLVHFCNIDYEREMAIVAEISEGNRRKIIGIARLVIEHDFKKGEYAVLVHDKYSGKGLGYKLVDILIGIAQEKGLEQIYGTVLQENKKMLRITRKIGFTENMLPDETVEVQITLK
jgi:acetyltransferase